MVMGASYPSHRYRGTARTVDERLGHTEEIERLDGDRHPRSCSGIASGAAPAARSRPARRWRWKTSSRSCRPPRPRLRRTILPRRSGRAATRDQSRRLPLHLPREEVIDVADKTCACCGGLKLRIGEDVLQRLDLVPAQFKVIVTRRPKFACQACAGEVVQAPAPERLIENGIPTEAWSRTCWSPSMPTTRRSIARRKSTHVKASRSIVPPWPIGLAAPPLRCGRYMRGSWSN